MRKETSPTCYDDCETGGTDEKEFMVFLEALLGLSVNMDFGRMLTEHAAEVLLMAGASQGSNLGGLWCNFLFNTQSEVDELSALMGSML